jgi:hypothetical protein
MYFLHVTTKMQIALKPAALHATLKVGFEVSECDAPQRRSINNSTLSPNWLSKLSSHTSKWKTLLEAIFQISHPPHNWWGWITRRGPCPLIWRFAETLKCFQRIFSIIKKYGSSFNFLTYCSFNMHIFQFHFQVFANEFSCRICWICVQRRTSEAG